MNNTDREITSIQRAIAESAGLRGWKDTSEGGVTWVLAGDDSKPVSFKKSKTEEEMWEQQSPKWASDLSKAMELFERLPRPCLEIHRVTWDNPDAVNSNYRDEIKIAEFTDKAISTAIAKAYCRHEGIRHE